MFTRENTSSLPVPETKFNGSEGERLVFFPTVEWRNWYCSTSSRRYTATLIRDIFSPGVTRPGLSRSFKNMQNIHNFAEGISFVEHGKFVAESSEFHLTLSRSHRAHFSNSKYGHKKSGTI